MGTGSIRGTTVTRSLSDNLDNLDDLKSRYPYYDGYFGSKGQSSGKVRNIVSDNPIATAKEFYQIAAKGGIEQQMLNGKGYTTKMKDGSIISYREVSTSDGSPAVDINIKRSINSGGIKQQKIHFVGG